MRLVMMIVVISSSGCLPAASQGDYADSGIADLKAELKQALKVDPSQLIVRSAQVVNMPKGGPGSEFYDVVLSVDAPSSAQLLTVSVCGVADTAASCRVSEHLTSTMKFGSEALGDRGDGGVRFKVRACVAQEYSLAAQERCGPEYQLTAVLPAGSQDEILQGYAAELDRLRQGFVRWDQQVKQTMAGFQQNIDKCDAELAKKNEADKTRMWLMIGTLLAGIPLQPSAMAAPSPTAEDRLTTTGSATTGSVDGQGWSSMVAEFEQGMSVLDTSVIQRAQTCAQRNQQNGKGELAAMCSVAALWAVKQKWDQIGEFRVGELATRLRGWQMSLQNFKIAGMGGWSEWMQDYDFAGLVNSYIPKPMGSPTELLFNVTQAVYDLSATDVVLPCGLRQSQKNKLENSIGHIIKRSRDAQCDLYEQIAARRAALKLPPPKVNICTQIKDEVKAELARVSSGQSEGMEEGEEL